MGTSVSVGGSTTTSGGSTSGGGSGGNGGTGGLSMGTPVNTTSSVGTVVNSMLMGLGAATGTTAIAQNFAAGLQRVATNIGLPVARVVQQVSRVISVQVAASTAGVVNMNNSIRGTIGAGGLGYQEAVQAAYNRGVQAYYDANSIPQSARMVPTGPMARTYGMAAVARDPAMASIDAAFNQGSVSVVNVETGTSLQHLREFLGPNLYDSLTDQQRVGAQRSVLVGGTLSTGPTATSSLGGLGVNLGEYTPNRSALTGATTYSAPGYVVVDTNRTDYATTMRHELQHAGDYENYEAARQVASDTTSSSVERARAQEVVDRLEPVVSQMVYRNLTRTGLAIAAGMSAAQVADLERRRNYLAQAAEVRAFAVDPTNRRGWVDRYSVVSRVSVEEAEAIFDSIVDQAGILDPNSPEAEFANDLLGGGN